MFIYLLKWRPDSKSIYVRERDSGENPHSTILEYDLATKSRSISSSTAPDYIIDLSFSRDGRPTAIVRGRLATVLHTARSSNWQLATRNLKSEISNLKSEI